tara:strand:+ start:19 stop:210 length:192 start_codon:yes stop_codon:yes gene_type:complete
MEVSMKSKKTQDLINEIIKLTAGQTFFDDFDCQREKRGICPWICCSEIQEDYDEEINNNKGDK